MLEHKSERHFAHAQSSSQQKTSFKPWAGDSYNWWNAPDILMIGSIGAKQKWSGWFYINCSNVTISWWDWHTRSVSAYLLQYATQLGLVLQAGSFSFHPQQQLRLPVGFQSEQVDDALPQRLLWCRGHASIPSVIKRRLLEAAVWCRRRSRPFMELNTFTWKANEMRSTLNTCYNAFKYAQHMQKKLNLSELTFRQAETQEYCNWCTLKGERKSVIQVFKKDSQVCAHTLWTALLITDWETATYSSSTFY